MQNQWIKLRGTRVQYGFLSHRNCFFANQYVRKFYKISKFKVELFLKNFKISKNS